MACKMASLTVCNRWVFRSRYTVKAGPHPLTDQARVGPIYQINLFTRSTLFSANIARPLYALYFMVQQTEYRYWIPVQQTEYRY